MKAKDVRYVFKENPELKEIGTNTQYFKYLKTIFPDSKDKDVWFHGTDVDPSKIKTFRAGDGSYGPGLYLQSKHGKYHTEGFGKNTMAAIVNVNKVMDHNTEGKEILNELRPIFEKKGNLKDLQYGMQREMRLLGYDSLIEDFSGMSKYLLMRKPYNAHILGSQKDKEGFKKFVSQNKGDSLEKKLITGFFMFSFLTGLILSGNSLTGNVIGVLYGNFNFYWPVLALVGIVGIYTTRKLKKWK